MSSTVGYGDLLLVSPLIILFLASLLPITIKVLRGNSEQPPIATLVQALGGIFAAMIVLIIVSGSGASAFSNAPQAKFHIAPGHCHRRFFGRAQA